MILYFSGTGNSEYAAKRIGKEIGDEVLNLFEKIKNSDVSALHSARPWIVVAPTYAWRIPRILHKWLQSTPLTGNKDLYFVMTCGGSIGNAAAHLEKLCAEKEMRYRGCAGIRMPENYIALFSTPTGEEAEPILRQAEKSIDSTALLIRRGDKLPQGSDRIWNAQQGPAALSLPETGLAKPAGQGRGLPAPPRRALALHGHKSPPPPSGRVLHSLRAPIKKQRAGRRGGSALCFCLCPCAVATLFLTERRPSPPRVRRSARCPAPCGSFLWYRRPRAAFCPP